MLLPWKCCQRKGREAMRALQVVAQALGVVAAVVVAVVAVVGISSLNKRVSSCSKVVHTNSHLLLPIMHPSCKVHACQKVSAVVNVVLCRYQQTRIDASCNFHCRFGYDVKLGIGMSTDLAVNGI